VLAGKAALLGGGPGSRAHEIGQTGEVLISLQHQRVGLLVRQHVLTEGGAERGQPFVDLGEAPLLGRFKRRAGAHEHGVIALQHARLLGGEAKPLACGMKRVDAPEQRLVHQDAVPVAGAAGRQLTLDGEQRVVGMSAGEHAEDAAHPVEEPPRAFHRLQGVGERRLRRFASDGRDLGVVAGKAALERRHEVFGFDGAERRHPEGARPVLEQRIIPVAGGFGGLVLCGHGRYMVARPCAGQGKVW
jgi:hypothetical protein